MLGNLPSGYNKAVHGPYDPAVFYGKADLPLSQVIIWFIFIFILTFRVFRWRFTSSLPGSLADSSTIPLLTGGLCPGRVNNGLSLEIYLLFHHQGLLALEPQVLSPQALRDHSLRSDVRRFLRSLLHHELRQHLWAQEPQIPLVDDTGSPSVQFSS